MASLNRGERAVGHVQVRTIPGPAGGGAVRAQPAENPLDTGGDSGELPARRTGQMASPAVDGTVIGAYTTGRGMRAIGGGAPVFGPTRSHGGEATVRCDQSASAKRKPPAPDSSFDRQRTRKAGSPCIDSNEPAARRVAPPGPESGVSPTLDGAADPYRTRTKQVGVHSREPAPGRIYPAVSSVPPAGQGAVCSQPTRLRRIHGYGGELPIRWILGYVTPAHDSTVRPYPAHLAAA